jgi:uncharacterized protein YgbK (DUF1537 family)
MKLVVIADDLTGAAEVAGAALRAGLQAEVHLGQVLDSVAEVIVVDADTRSMSPAAAFHRVLHLTEQVHRSHADVLFKKVDSLLRGPVLTELAAMHCAVPFQRCLLVCGNPRKRRTVVAGQIFVDGQLLQDTQFALDPEHPCRSSHLLELLRANVQHERTVPAQVQPWLDCLSTVNPGELQATSLSIGNVTSQAELTLHARRWLTQRQTTLPAGGAEFFEAILWELTGQRSPEIHPNSLLAVNGTSAPELLLVSGSRLCRNDNWPRVRFANKPTLEECNVQVRRMLIEHGRAALCAIDLIHGSPSERTQTVAELAASFLMAHRLDQVWIEGGRTASALMRQLGFQRLSVVGNAGDGIVALRNAHSNSPLFIIKPGSYPWGTAIPQYHSLPPHRNMELV